MKNISLNDLLDKINLHAMSMTEFTPSEMEVLASLVAAEIIREDLGIANEK